MTVIEAIQELTSVVRLYGDIPLKAIVKHSGENSFMDISFAVEEHAQAPSITFTRILRVRQLT